MIDEGIGIFNISATGLLATNNTWTGTNTFSGAVTFNSTSQFNDEVCITKDSAEALKVETGAGVNVLTVDTTNGNILMGDFQTGVDNAVRYYSGSTQKFIAGWHESGDAWVLSKDTGDFTGLNDVIKVEHAGNDVDFLNGTRVRIMSDNTGIRWGAGADSGIFYTGTDMVFESQFVGTGDFRFDGGDIKFNLDNQSYGVGASEDGTWTWDGTNSIHNVLTGEHTFTGGRFNTVAVGRRVNQRTETGTTVTVTVNDEYFFNDATAASQTNNLPTAVGNPGQRFNFKKIDSTGNTVTIDGNGTETIDGSLTQVISVQYDSITIVSDNANWFIV